MRILLEALQFCATFFSDIKLNSRHCIKDSLTTGIYKKSAEDQDPEYNDFQEEFTNHILICCFICMCAALIIKVSLQVTVEAVIGGSVVLPCEHDHKLQDTNVHWRDKDSKTVYDIVKGEDSVAEQDPWYKNRVETFPKEYLRGNFSLKLINLTLADAGAFSCFITPSSECQTVQLIINESTAEKGNKTTEQENQGPETQSDWMTILICVSTLLVLIVLPVA